MRRKMLSLHRGMGAVIAFFLLLFAVTGILINHSVDLELDKRFINWPWLMQQYGMREVSPDASFLIDNKVISQFETKLFVDDKPVTTIHRALLGAIVLEDIIVLATDQALLLLTREGEFVERLGGEIGIPIGIQNIGLFHGEPVLQTKQGMWRSDYLLDQWEAIDLHGVAWSEPYPIPEIVKEDLRQFFYGKGISVQQLVIDIHNGHILGQVGVWLVDLIGLLVVFLALTGLWMWLWRYR